MKSDIVRFTAVPTAVLRCPLFGDDPDAQRFWNGLWTARLRIFGRLFPFVGQSIRTLAGLPRDAAIGGGGDHAANVAYLAAHDEYAKGYRSERPEVRAIHDRQNAEWEALTRLPALGSLNDWRAAAAAAGFPPADFEQHDFERMADCILAWAQARIANGATAGDGGAGGDQGPGEPVKYAIGWRDILVTLGLANNKEDRERVRNLNDSLEGPILVPKQGAHPKANKAKLIEWWNRLEIEWEAGHNRSRDAGPTVASQHDYGADGRVAPDLAGSVKRRRKTPNRTSPEKT